MYVYVCVFVFTDKLIYRIWGYLFIIRWQSLKWHDKNLCQSLCIFLFSDEYVSWGSFYIYDWWENFNPWGGDTAHRTDSSFAPSQWETALLRNDVSHWLGANLESVLCIRNVFPHWLRTWRCSTGFAGNYVGLIRYVTKKCVTKAFLMTSQTTGKSTVVQHNNKGDINDPHDWTFDDKGAPLRKDPQYGMKYWLIHVSPKRWQLSEKIWLL